MVVCKKVRLLTKDNKGYFNPDGQKQELRSRCIISVDSVEASERECKESGILYIIDQDATRDRNESKQPKKLKIKKD
tara:strand:- start:130 stop:360 length:231 start_codon:yes stop_codon:yes gene_type:complete